MMKMDPKNKSNTFKSKTLSNHRKQEDQWTEHQRGENRRIELKAEAEKSSKSDTNNGKKCHTSDSSAHFIVTPPLC